MSKEIVKNEATTAVSVPLDQIPGLEGFEADMLIIPRLKIVQLSSVETTDLGIRPGTLVNSLTKEIIAEPETPIEIVPLSISKSRIYFLDPDDGGGISCSAYDGRHGEGDPGGDCQNCPLRQWQGKDVPPICTEFINIPIVPLNDEMQPLIAPFAKTSFKVGITFANMMAAKRQSPWLFKYEIQTKFVENKKGKYFIYKIKPAGKTPEELAAMLEESYRMLASTQFVADFDEEEVKTEQANMAQPEDELPY